MTIQDQIIEDVEFIEAAMLRLERATAGMDDAIIDDAASGALYSLREWLSAVVNVAVDRVRESMS